jgi:hypothetical protein
MCTQKGGLEKLLIGWNDFLDGRIRGHLQRGEKEFAPLDRRNPPFAKSEKEGAPSSSWVVGASEVTEEL